MHTATTTAIGTEGQGPGAGLCAVPDLDQERDTPARLAGPIRPARLAHPAGRGATGEHVRLGARIADDEAGSLVTEYGLLAVVAATIAGAVIQWASGGAMTTLFNALIRTARGLVGA